MSVEASQIVDAALVEKVFLVSLVSLIFAQVLVGVQASDLELVEGVALIVILNASLSHWLARRGFGGAFTLQQFIVLVAVNSLVMLVYTGLRTLLGEPVSLANALFYVVIFSLLITLFDHYRQVYLIRFSALEATPQKDNG